MRILLMLSYAFSLWMLIDALKRDAKPYWYVIIFFPLGEWVYFFMVKIHDFTGGRGQSDSTKKCRSCRHCVQIYDDGVKCSASGKPLFMTTTHVDYCDRYLDAMR
jgi:hypothetical protein